MFGSLSSDRPAGERGTKSFGSTSSTAPLLSAAPVRLPRRVVVARVLREVVLWVAAAIGVLCLLVAAAAVVFRVTPLVFRSGSMTPAIPTGSVALARPESPAEVRIGQVVSVELPDGTRVTHRVVHVTVEGDTARLRLKGDANRHEDPEAVVTSSVDRVFWSVPRLGYLLEEASHAPVVFVGGALIGMIAMWGFRRPSPLPGEVGPPASGADGSSPDGPGVGGSSTDGSGDDGDGPAGGGGSGLEARHASAAAPRRADDPAPSAVRHAAGPRHADPGRLRRSVPHRGRERWRPGPGAAICAGGVVVVLGGSILLGADPAAAAGWTDPVTATSPVLTAGRLTAPTSLTCSPTNGITLTWSAPAAASVRPDHYTIGITNSGLGTGLANPGPLTGTSYSFGPSLLTVGNTYTFTITAWAGSGWSSTFAGTRSATVLLGLIVSCNNAA